MKIRNIKKYAIALIDIDDFKEVNTLYLYEGGDRALQEAARILKNDVVDFNRKYKTTLEVYRRGGDEFAVLALRVPQKKFSQLIQNIKLRVKKEQIVVSDMRGLETTINISFSAGVHVSALPRKRKIKSGDLERIANNRLSEEKKRKKGK